MVETLRDPVQLMVAAFEDMAVGRLSSSVSILGWDTVGLG